jgi:hypothetical protein
MELQDKDVSLKMLGRVLPLLEGLHPCGTERDAAGNRRLFFDDYVKLTLVYLFNPLIDSISMLQRAAALPKLARQLGISDFSKASFSEAPAVFEPWMLEQAIGELAGELRKLPADPRLADIKQVISLADGTLLTALPKLVETLYRPNRDGSPLHAWRVHTVLDLASGLPSVMRLTGGSPRGADNERRVLESVLQSNHLYVNDRGYVDAKLANRIVEVGSSYVTRLHDNATYQLIEPRPVSKAAAAAGVLSDAVVQLPGMNHPARLVIVQAEVHTKRTRKGYVQSSGQMLLLCNDLTLEPELISLLYRYRWTIEMFHSYCLHCNTLYQLCGPEFWLRQFGRMRLAVPASGAGAQLAQTVQLVFIGPYGPSRLAAGHHDASGLNPAAAHPTVERRLRQVQHAGQIGEPPFVRLQHHGCWTGGRFSTPVQDRSDHSRVESCSPFGWPPMFFVKALRDLGGRELLVA